MNQVPQRLLRLLRRGQLPDFRAHFSRALKQYKNRAWRSFDMISLVATDPPVLLTGCHPDKLLEHLHPRLAGLDLTIFYRAGWSMEHAPSFLDRTRAIKRAQQKFPRHRYIFAANTPHEVVLMQEAGIQAEFLNENAFIDEFSFRLAEDGPKKFDAVLDAQIAPYKRLELAAQVSNLVVITFVMAERFDADYSATVRRALQGATWANGPYWESSYRRMNRDEVANIYRQARVALCLSALEGANLASIQALLTGLSVVSTPSQGGRDVFFSEEYAAVVPAEAPAVAAAVAHFVRSGLSPASIRERTLAKIWPIRRHFSQILSRELGHPETGEDWWRDFNSKNPLRYQDLKKIAGTLAQAHGLR